MTTDFLVIGGGIVGLCIALEVRRRHPDARVLLVEKEPAVGRHASGRNSGVLHAGFYYSADSLKARFTRDGNRRLAAYCEERGLRIRRCGKLIVARTAAEHAGLDELLRRGKANGVELHPLTAAEARRIEPLVQTRERALFSPATASVDPIEVVRALAADARAAGIEIRTGTAYLGRRGGDAVLAGGAVSAGYVINAAGLHADRVARDFGFGAQYRILPFKGLYLYDDASHLGLRTHIYPVPDLANPFLGVHFTVTVDGRAKIGPTAIPAFWREHYRGLDNFRPTEMLEIVFREARLFAENAFGFRALAWRELRKYSRARLVALASGLVAARLDGVRWRWGEPGIRAQLLDLRNRRLVMDFHVEGDDRSFHVLNAVSPAFTCALPFAEFTLDEVDRRLG